ncbi:MAG: YjbH domain-containing protein, partial [Simkaniaceae bacterium]|nr:YjbH domain-containing protein [Simkaniaceae bacterium]
MLEEIEEVLNDTLPFIYNNVLLGGYFMMPSARMQKAGMAAIGGANVPPYNYYNLNFQLFDILEFSGNYRIYRGIKDVNLGEFGFGDFYDRGANFKLCLYQQSQEYKYIPSFAIGYEDFHGSRSFSSFYLIATKELLAQNLEMTIGWGKGRMKGLFGGMGWTPFRKSGFRFIDGITLMAEYDAFDYKKHPHEHPEGRSVSSRVNVGISARLAKTLQLQVSSVRGKEVGGSVTFNYNFGETEGFFPKLDNPSLYKAPLDLQALGHLRTEKELARELACAFNGQGFALYRVHLIPGDFGEKNLRIKLINTMYRTEEDVRERVTYILSTLSPSNIANITVVIEADGVSIHEYHFQANALRLFREKSIGAYELGALSPLEEVSPQPGKYDGTELYRRKKSIWMFTFRPRFLTFLGSAKGKFKYSVGLVGGPEGYLFDEVYYKLQLSYAIHSSFSDVGDMDKLNPSQIINVRSDSVRYYQSNTVSLEQAFL